ncbi:type IV secretion system protein [Aurantiacibacter sp. D1-12]|uniref:type IV secretion system protein n=1 Tax=Aurantiacibacter sp. D1-12 TaxID=2993658 RepID=UPI00237D2746|nr:type IV secretion system protein [Aurantiacibacter sp. D1-12]MDE1466114.1 type IV secretion system protein [Aurantiacibacter sp. D1-12]
MSCPQILTGTEFVTRMVTHIDCQARYLGSYGYEALGQPGSAASLAMTGLLTLFIAIWGFRLLFGYTPDSRDIMGDMLKVGIVLTLAFSWPAFRTVVHDVTLDGPAQLAASLSNPGLATTSGGFVERLQGVDNGVLALIDLGTGRWSDQLIDGQAGNASFVGTALQDDAALGWARLIYLAGIIGSLGLLRIVAGLLLALAPLAAGMLLFEATRGLFAGWLRALALTLVGSVGVTVILAVELAVLEPFLRDVLLVRGSGYAAPSAPIELFAMTTGFTIVQLMTIWLLAKIAFMRGWTNAIRLPDFSSSAGWQSAIAGPTAREVSPLASRAERIAQQVENRMSFEQSRIVSVTGGGAAASARVRGSPSADSARVVLPERLGNSYRRTTHSRSISSRRRDG